jgi:hypothetical protein
MSSDRARVSYDPTRQYRLVVAQQGRVTLEADVNEAQEIAGENLRAETIDIVGPCGTPDNGYEIKAGPPAPDFAVGPGTMYVGGLRVELSQACTYFTQPEWLDHAGDPLWAATDAAGHGPEFVYLLLREQEVSAVEDTVLREVALGGPDTAQRKRLIQRVVRLRVNTDKCATALNIAKKRWTQLGVAFDAASMMLKSPARLKVGFTQDPAPETPCDPPVQGGYLGADNQLIRVQLVGTDPESGKTRLVWGFNNASFLYRVKLLAPGDKKTLELLSTPIDTYHAPSNNRPVEVLRSAIDLKDGDTIAAHFGIVPATPQVYVPETRRLVLQNDLPQAYVDDTAPLYLRLWEQEIDFTSGETVPLGNTGLQVTIDLHGALGALTAGQFWMFAVRPSTPVELYPRRYLAGAQPPEGPRLWACPLATIGWTQNAFTLLDDCREKFDNLVELTKRRTECCSIVVTPDDVGNGRGLQDLLNSLSGKVATLALQPGLYELSRPLELDEKHNGLTLEGCHDCHPTKGKDGVVCGATLTARERDKNNFKGPLIELARVTDLTLRKLCLEVPLGSSSQAVGIHAGDCSNLHIEGCVFRIEPRAGAVHAAAIWVGGRCPDLRIERNYFLHEGKFNPGKSLSFIGVAASKELPGGDWSHPAAILENASICENEFTGLSYAVFVAAQFGMIWCENNYAYNVHGGFYFGVEEAQKLVPQLRFIANSVVVFASKSEGPVLPGAPRSGLTVSFEMSTESARSTLVMQSNELTGALVLPIAHIKQPTMAVVTGNLICNDEDTRVSLAIDCRDPLMIVSGNVFKGAPSINPSPPHNSGVVASSWHMLNSWKPIENTQGFTQVFFDDFTNGANPAWGNERGSWRALDGAYDATSPSNNPMTYSSVTTLPKLTDFTVKVTVNNLNDGGLWLRSSFNGGAINGVLLVTGGYGGSFDGLYFHVFRNGNPGDPLSKVDVPGLQGKNVDLRVIVAGNTYSVFLNDAETPVATLVDSTFSSGSFGLYDFSPTSGASTPRGQTFRNVYISCP